MSETPTTRPFSTTIRNLRKKTSGNRQAPGAKADVMFKSSKVLQHFLVYEM